MKPKLRAAAAAALLTLPLLGAPVALASTPVLSPTAIVAPIPAGTSLFALSSVWNTALPVNARLTSNSTALSHALYDEVSKETAGNYGPWINTDTDSVPVYLVGAAIPRVHVALSTYNPSLQAEFNAVPVPSFAHASRGDEHLVIYQPSSNTVWEFWQMVPHADGSWTAAWGGVTHNETRDAGYFSGAYGASGTGLPLLGGLITINELRTLNIPHALAMAVPNTAAPYVWPAKRSDGTTTDATAIPEGTQFRIDPRLDLSTLHLTPVGLAIATAAQRYGMIVRDTAGATVFYGEDPTVLPTSPYPQILGGRYPNQVLAGFPWNRLQVVAPRSLTPLPEPSLRARGPLGGPPQRQADTKPGVLSHTPVGRNRLHLPR